MDTLREVALKMQDMSYCEEPESYSRTHVCAGVAGRGTTPGDSGGPLLVVRNHRWVQFGVTSYGVMMPVAGNRKIFKDLGLL